MFQDYFQVFKTATWVYNKCFILKPQFFFACISIIYIKVVRMSIIHCMQMILSFPYTDFPTGHSGAEQAKSGTVTDVAPKLATVCFTIRQSWYWLILLSIRRKQKHVFMLLLAPTSMLGFKTRKLKNMFGIYFFFVRMKMKNLDCTVMQTFIINKSTNHFSTSSTFSYLKEMDIVADTVFFWS